MSSTRRRFLQVAAASGVAASIPRAAAAAYAGTARASSSPREPAEGEIVLVLTGDLFLTDPLAPAADPDARGLLDVLGAADLVIANLENGLSTVGSAELGGFRHGPGLRGDPVLVRDLAALRIGAVSLANNHTGNYGREALLQTCEVLDTAGVAHAGAGRSADEAFAPAYLRVRDRTVALCSVYSYYYNFQANDSAGARTPGVAGCRAFDVLLEVPTGFETSRRDEPPFRIEPQPGGAHVVMAPLKEDVERMAASVREARRQADLVVVAAHLHWGRHGRFDVAVQKRAFAHAAIDAGADLFVGHGPHVARGIEIYRGRPIAHSLGNFVLRRPERPPAPPGDGALPPTRESFVLRATVGRDSRIELEAVPIVIPGDGRPRLSRDRRAELAIARIQGLSSSFGTELIGGPAHARLSL